ncbi:hypothetical protein LshimejAT787_1301100 [Lyophyllum shimeji]|uniref:Protein kinase domain-containing protein n=1 Tax=Lyophyllum shimeji TaxID=47721 RepID=A0A9P3UPV5_LYOSH|nr:hypothetical protein LshimejAT787_1301100 [Lyophyllum shimeji]
MQGKRLGAEIDSLLDYNPQPLIPDPGSVCSRLTPPLSFYDKHLDKRLSLRRIIPIPSLTADLSAVVERTIKNVTDQKVVLPNVDSDFPTLKSLETLLEKGPVKDAKAVGDAYQMVTSALATDLASMFLLHPNAPRWSSSFLLVKRPITKYQPLQPLNENFVPVVSKPHTEPEDIDMIPEDTWNSMDQARQDDLKQVMERFPLLAVWQMFFVCREAEDALNYMSKLARTDAFPHCTFLTSAAGHVPADIDLPRYPDALNTAWSSSLSSFTSGYATAPGATTGLASESTNAARLKHPLRRSIRLSARTAVSRGESTTKATKSSPSRKPLRTALSNGRWGDVTIPSESLATGPPEKKMAASMLQHAWTRAVERDASFIVLHSGNFERIAFRHRSTQTLFISDLIDVTLCKNPAYGKLHIGLFMSIIEDVLDRTRQLVQFDMETESRQPKKRKREVQASDTRKRPKTRASVAREATQQMEQRKNFKIVSEEVANRPLALLRIQEHPFNSPAPASFLPAGLPRAARKAVYTSHEYIYLTLTSKIGGGATGDVHAAAIELYADGTAYSLSDVVVKLAFEAGQRKRMRHEFEVYEHLKSSGVTGIPHVFGLFQDVEGDTLALVMSNVGTSLWDRRPDKEDIEFFASKAERIAFARVLESIHDAGVRHRDIRAENLLVDDSGVVSIVDFDQAVLNASERSREAELKHLLSLLDGDFSTIGALPSFGTPREYDTEESKSPDEIDRDISGSPDLS